MSSGFAHFLQRAAGTLCQLRLAKACRPCFAMEDFFFFVRRMVYIIRKGVLLFSSDTRSLDTRYLKKLFFIALFTDKKRGKSHIRGFPPLIYLPPCRLAATGANTLPRPSRYSIATATGSKRLSADSDSLLCHVRLWRTSRELTHTRSVCVGVAETG